MTKPLDPVEKETNYYQRLKAKRQYDPRTCPCAGAFCAFCPNVDGLPCTLAGGYSMCYNAVAYRQHDAITKANSGRYAYAVFQCLCDCACKTPPTPERMTAYMAWEERLALNNHLADVADRPIRRRRWQVDHDEQLQAQGHMRRKAHKCAVCGVPITGTGKSGLCMRCVRLYPKEARA